MNLSKLSASALIAIGGLAATSANAALISYTQAFNLGSRTLADYETGTSTSAPTSAWETQDLLLSGFNGSLGTLTGVSLTFASNWSLNGKVTASDDINNELFSEYTSGAAQATSRMTVDLVSFGGPEQSSDQAVSPSCSSAGTWSSAACDGSVAMDGQFNGSLFLGGISLSSFIDTNLLLSLTKTVTAEVTACDSDSRCYGHNFNNGWSGSITVDYMYDAVSVPESSTLALSAMGLLGLLLGRRRVRD